MLTFFFILLQCWFQERKRVVLQTKTNKTDRSLIAEKVWSFFLLHEVCTLHTTFFYQIHSFIVLSCNNNRELTISVKPVQNTLHFITSLWRTVTKHSTVLDPKCTDVCFDPAQDGGGGGGWIWRCSIITICLINNLRILMLIFLSNVYRIELSLPAIVADMSWHGITSWP